MGRIRLFIPILTLVSLGYAQKPPSAATQAAPSFFSTKTDSTTGSTPRGIVALDYNADGVMDVAVINSGDSSISLLKGNGAGAMAGDQVYPLTTPVAVATRDFDEDGLRDLVITNLGFDIGGGYVMLARLQQPPPKTTLGNLGTFDTGQQIAGGDFNGDGHQDFVAVSPLGSSFTVVLCNGNGTCQPAVNYTAGSFPRGVAAADVNGDGRLDVVVSLSGENSVGVFLNSGTGTFGAPVKYPTANSPSWVVAGDFSGDGKPDIAVINTVPGTASVLINNGDGTFKAKVDYPAGTFAMATADFNGDGRVDLAATNETTNLVNILLGNGDGTFQAALNLPAGNGPRNIVAADFDGDGTADLAVTEGNESKVSVWLNTRLTTPPAPFPAAVQPTVSSGATQTLTITYGAFGGFATIDVLNVLINTALDGRQACYLAYVRSANTLYIVADNGDSSQITGKVMDGTGTVANSQCTVTLAGSSATGSGNTFTLVLNMSFTAPFGGNKVIYAAARDTAGRNSGWNTMGAHFVPGATTTFPNPTGMTPAGGVTSGLTYKFTYQDQTDANNLQTVWALINTAIDGRTACYVAYYKPGNQVFLYPDNGDGSQATSMVLTGTNTLSNSQCTIFAQGSSTQVTGATLTVNLRIAFKPAFAGHKGAFLAAQTLAGAVSPWQALGAWTMPSEIVQ